MRNQLLTGLLLALFAAAPRASASSAAAVTADNLLENERFWPYQVVVTTPVGALKPGTIGVLIRLETAEIARIDFGRDGLHETPVAATDLVERANRVRRGELQKKAPNFVLAVAPRLVDTSSPAPAQYSFERAGRQRGFLAVFADPGAAEFAQIAGALAPLAKRDGLLTILFPQGAHPDSAVFEKVRDTGWNVPFVYSHLTEPYTRSLLPKDTQRPAVMLQTPEGRVLFQSGWRDGTAAELRRAIDAALGADS